MYLTLKALHIIFIVTWFAGMFYMVRLFIYAREANDKPPAVRDILQGQFAIMQKRLWYGITWPSALLTLVLGPVIWWLLGSFPKWLAIKLVFVLGLYAYHLSLHFIYKQQRKGVFKYSSKWLRVWNEVASIFLFAIVFIAVVKEELVWVKALVGLVIFALLLMSAVKLYQILRTPSR